MGYLRYTQCDYKSDFAINIRKSHSALIRTLETQYGTKICESFARRNEILNKPNIGYLNFIGRINNEEKNITYWSHSGIHSKSKSIACLEEEILQYYVDKASNPIFDDGTVSQNNKTLTYLPKIEESFDNSPMWLRNSDTESKLIERLLENIEDLNKENLDLEGDMFIYTTFNPCLSCENKISDLLVYNEKLNIDIWYSRNY